MSEIKCHVFPSGTNSWHVWGTGAKEGDPCQCGQLPYRECHIPKEPGKYDCTTMREVLEWASENVWLQRWPERSHEERWTAYPLGISKWHNAPTLYDALHKAWSARDTTKDL